MSSVSNLLRSCELHDGGKPQSLTLLNLEDGIYGLFHGMFRGQAGSVKNARLGGWRPFNSRSDITDSKAHRTKSLWGLGSGRRLRPVGIKMTTGQRPLCSW